jgi:hypothetical protein
LALLIRFRAPKFEPHPMLSDIDIFDPERSKLGPAERRREAEQKDSPVSDARSGLRERSRHGPELLDRQRPLKYRCGPEHAPSASERLPNHLRGGRVGLVIVEMSVPNCGEMPDEGCGSDTSLHLGCQKHRHTIGLSGQRFDLALRAPLLELVLARPVDTARMARETGRDKVVNDLPFRKSLDAYLRPLGVGSSALFSHVFPPRFLRPKTVILGRNYFKLSA